MCDTVLALPDISAERSTLFGKNSDRYRNEAQVVQRLPRAEHSPGDQLRCTYITISQVLRTHAVLICRPFWIWGAEMGANEHGVVIGNEGLQARGPEPTQEALIGMDLLRLALERATTADEAVEVMTRLLQRHGQGGNCGHLKASYYHNSFMIADAQSAFVLETIGREWLLERIRKGVRTISNAYSIGRRPERTSEGLSKLLRDSAWTVDESPDFAEALANPQMQFIGDSAARRARSTGLLQARSGRLCAADVMAVLRDHGVESTPSEWHPRAQTRRTLCQHAGDERVATQTTGSWVSELSRGRSVHWVTGTAAPCISIFKPLVIDAQFPVEDPVATDRFDPDVMWWRHERLHRGALRGDFAGFIAGIREERDALEASFQLRMRIVINSAGPVECAQVIADCWLEALKMEERWYRELNLACPADETSYAATWQKMNELAGVSWDPPGPRSEPK